VEGEAAPPGTVVIAQGDRLRVATGAGLIDLLEVQAEGKRPMTARDFLAGRALQAGSQLTSAP
jgi:methionyl-tRNA formyltransferase